MLHSRPLTLCLLKGWLIRLAFCSTCLNRFGTRLGLRWLCPVAAASLREEWSKGTCALDKETLSLAKAVRVFCMEAELL